MLKAFQIKILLAIAALLAVIAGGIVWHTSRERAAARHDAEVKEFVRRQHERKSAYPVNGSDTNDHYIP